VTPVQSISETDIMPASYANTSYANILYQLMPTESMHLFDFDFPHHLGITKIHMKIMSQHLVIVSRSAVLHDTLTLEEDPGVSEYLSEYILLCQSAC
jgi:hypothetical protein